uniref:Uncharacterized protein n=1 Tax=Sus scrofa TaxID=9823 RepID=A0A4X1U6J9_PIG
MCPAVQAEGLKSACFEVKPPLLDQGRGDLLKPMDLPWSHPVRPPHPQSQWALSAQPEEDWGLPAHVGEGPPSLTWVLCSGSHWLCPQVPALPVLPVLSIFVNVYLMMQMSSVTWAQCGIWNVVGPAILLLRTHPEELKAPSRRILCTAFFLAALLTRARTRSTPSAHGPTKGCQRSCVHTAVCCSALRRKGMLTHAAPCVYLTDILLSKGGSSSTLSGMLGQHVRQFGEKLVRRRPLEPSDESEIPTPHLNTLNLVLFGVNIPKARIYILAGAMAVHVAGPAIIISFLLVGLFAVLCAICFAEFGARVSCCGSVYLYSYVTMGQLYAFITGWTLILHLRVATAYLTRAWSYNFDSLIGNHISQKLEGTFSEHMPLFLAPYPDFVALALVLLMAGLLILGVQVTELVRKVATGFNVLVLSFVILSGFIKGDLHNWQLTEQDYKLATSGSPDSYSLGPLGSGGFVPFGFEGILQGAAMPFYTFLGLNAIVNKGKETTNPQRSIPSSLEIVISSCILTYSGVTAAHTLMVPYYQIHPYNPLPQAFHHVGWDPAGYFVAVVILCALFHSLLVVMLAMSRLICAMAEDGLLFRGLGQIYARRGTPLVAILVSATLSDTNQTRVSARRRKQRRKFS